MANIKSQIKRVKTNSKTNLANKSFKSSVKTAIKKAEIAITAQEANASELVNTAITLVDKAVTKGIYHANKAAHVKSRLMLKTH
ncbi:30S ribosomal protein S20 [Spiroplasma citri]|uniref:Small ribosomal subunit protein bS20 n=1 Tax=Spiroplasma citri TaxID=2133 RepID=Q14PY0_SPICI|nr:30S ribosomal protein S20 [Spiroplasma citri]APE74118.1 30S ribosomal protein S20 [Spiroplasma citri]QED24099.1 30S ribosomal protein S20 [Spiroplasma citri]QIA66378.1 30S ribosomal protein S20 [Spiroplasma citri]QIA68255.1 30S ribosomal protein S20 [Spiroplasma citri]QIA70130.1 30S ribosomal protein S20 [Spiroplasma citri]